MLNACLPNPSAAHVATQLARQAHRAIQAWDMADEAMDHARTALHADRLDALCKEVSWHPCGSPEAALFQLCVVSALADDLRCLARDGGDEVKAEQVYASTQRLLGSVMRWIEKSTGVRRTDYGLTYFHADDCERLAWGQPLDREAA